MSNSFSAVVRLGGDAESRAVGDRTVINFNGAISTGYGSKEKTMWIRAAYWRNAQALLPYLKKGSQVYVSGELSENAYTGNDGIEKKSLELNVNTIDLIGSKKEATVANNAPAQAPAQAPSHAGQSQGGADYLDDDIPF